MILFPQIKMNYLHTQTNLNLMLTKAYFIEHQATYSEEAENIEEKILNILLEFPNDSHFTQHCFTLLYLYEIDVKEFIIRNFDVFIDVWFYQWYYVNEMFLELILNHSDLILYQDKITQIITKIILTKKNYSLIHLCTKILLKFRLDENLLVQIVETLIRNFLYETNFYQKEFLFEFLLEQNTEIIKSKGLFIEFCKQENLIHQEVYWRLFEKWIRTDVDFRKLLFSSKFQEEDSYQVVFNERIKRLHEYYIFEDIFNRLNFLDEHKLDFTIKTLEDKPKYRILLGTNIKFIRNCMMNLKNEYNSLQCKYLTILSLLVEFKDKSAVIPQVTNSFVEFIPNLIEKARQGFLDIINPIVANTEHFREYLLRSLYLLSSLSKGPKNVCVQFKDYFKLVQEFYFILANDEVLNIILFTLKNVCIYYCYSEELDLVKFIHYCKSYFSEYETTMGILQALLYMIKENHTDYWETKLKLVYSKKENLNWCPDHDAVEYFIKE